MSISLSNPYFTYPGAPCRGYNEREVYHGESVRLLEYIQELELLPEMLLHISVGAAMEERWVDGFRDPEFRKHMQWKQVLPDHVIDHALSRRRTPVRVIVVSPNSGFSPRAFVAPECIAATNQFFRWKKWERSYKATTCDMELHIFCTPMPHDDAKRNRTLMSHVAEVAPELLAGPQFRCLEQTPEDRQWIHQFYTALGECFDRVTQTGGLVTCFSFAVFNGDNSFAQFNNYAMFSELCSLFRGHDVRKRLLAEWTYNLENTMVKPNNKLVGPVNYAVSNFDVCNRNGELLIDFSNVIV